MKRAALAALLCSGALATTLLTAPAATAAPGDPGTVLTSAAYPSAKWIKGTGSATTFTYVTPDSQGRSATSGGVLFLPSGPAPAGGWPLIAWGHGTTGLADACAPSAIGYQDDTSLPNWIARGYAVVASDYVGLGTPGVHPYLDADSEARSVLDSVRAAHAVNASLSTSYAVVGHSQGGQAVLKAMTLAASYAPGFDFRGGVAYAPATNLDPVIGIAGPGLPQLPIGGAGVTNFLADILAGMRATYPALGVDSSLSVTGKAMVDDAEALCSAAFRTKYPAVAIGAMFVKPLTSTAMQTALRDYLPVPVKGYPKPFLVAQGLTDTTVPAPLNLALAGALSLNGQPATFKTYPGDHFAVLAQAAPDATAFVQKLLPAPRP